MWRPTIYVVRHGFRETWPGSGPIDAHLSQHGFHQAEELGSYLTSVDPPVGAIYSSPLVRCLQTITPAVRALEKHGRKSVDIRVEHGLGEWFGAGGSMNYIPSTTADLQAVFPACSKEYKSICEPVLEGETVEQLHSRLARVLTKILTASPQDQEGKPEAILLCSHAANVVAIGRILTGKASSKVSKQDPAAFTCGVSKYVKKVEEDSNSIKGLSEEDNKVLGIWEIQVDCDCHFLKDGEERGWRFSGLDWPTKEPLGVAGEMDDGTGLGFVVSGRAGAFRV